MNYVAGFLFSGRAYPRVVLIQKTKPAWQRGKLNGVGGKIEEGETPAAAMCREFQEETGTYIPESNWEEFCVLCIGDVTIHFFKAFCGYNSVFVKSTTEEAVAWYPVHLLRMESVLPNLNWLIPMALDPDQPIAAVEQVSPIAQDREEETTVNDKIGLWNAQLSEAEL